MSSPQHLISRPIEPPRPTPETETFWQAANDGQLLIKHCDACDQPHYPPRSLCPHCFSPRTRWLPASGKGTLYSFSVVRRTPVPYVMAYVRLAEGPIMMTNLTDIPFGEIAIGQEMVVTFRPSENGQQVPLFTRA